MPGNGSLSRHNSENSQRARKKTKNHRAQSRALGYRRQSLEQWTLSGQSMPAPYLCCLRLLLSNPGSKPPRATWVGDVYAPTRPVGGHAVGTRKPPQGHPKAPTKRQQRLETDRRPRTTDHPGANAEGRMQNAECPETARGGEGKRQSTLRSNATEDGCPLRSSGRDCSVSFGKRAGVRWNGPYSHLTSQAIDGAVKLFESSGRAGGLPSGVTSAPGLEPSFATADADEPGVPGERHGGAVPGHRGSEVAPE
jgi:hypothetical protein